MKTTTEVMKMPKKDKKTHRPTDRANLSQNLDQREKINRDPNGQSGRNPK